MKEEGYFQIRPYKEGLAIFYQPYKDQSGPGRFIPLTLEQADGLAKTLFSNIATLQQDGATS